MLLVAPGLEGSPGKSRNQHHVPMEDIYQMATPPWWQTRGYGDLYGALHQDFLLLPEIGGY